MRLGNRRSMLGKVQVVMVRVRFLLALAYFVPLNSSS